MLDNLKDKQLSKNFYLELFLLISILQMFFYVIIFSENKLKTMVDIISFRSKNDSMDINIDPILVNYMIDIQT